MTYGDGYMCSVNASSVSNLCNAKSRESKTESRLPPEYLYPHGVRYMHARPIAFITTDLVDGIDSGGTGGGIPGGGLGPEPLPLSEFPVPA